MNPRRRSYVPLAAMAVAVTAITACSSSSSSSASSSTAQSTSGATTSGSVIKLGIITDVGGAVNDADEVAAARAAVRGVNKRGGINGHPVELVFCNGALSPVTDGACVREMIGDKVMAMVGDEMVAYEESGDKLFAAAGIASVSPVAYSYDYQDPNSYLISGAEVFLNAGQDVAAVKYGGKRVGFIVVDIPTTVPYMAAHKKLLPLLSGTYAGDIEVPEVATDYADPAAALEATKPDVIDTDSTEASDIEVFKDMASLGFTGKEVVAADALTQSDYKGLGSLANRILIVSAFPPVSAASQFPGIAQYKADMAAELASGDQTAAGYATFNRDVALDSYFGVIAVQKIADQAKATTAAEFKTAINAAKDVNLGGVVPPWTPNASISTAVPRASNGAMYISQWDNGTEKLLTTTPIQVANYVNESN
jgi:ABC-type branched-subunit amino acid transport system substrate-binding protein